MGGDGWDGVGTRMGWKASGEQMPVQKNMRRCGHEGRRGEVFFPTPILFHVEFPFF